MSDTIRSATQRVKCVAEPLSGSLFEGAKPRWLKPGEALFIGGQPGEGCYRLERGLLKVVVTSPEGKERILALLGAGAIVGDLAMIDGGPRSASVFAVEDCELSFINRTAFEERTLRNPQIYRYLISVVAARSRRIDQAMATDSFLSAQARLARALLDLAEHVGADDGMGGVLIRQKISQNDLAAMTGLARENVSRMLSDWKRRQVVTRESGVYRLRNIAGLQGSMRLDKEPQRVARNTNGFTLSSLRLGSQRLLAGESKRERVDA
jgi:CRP/FNR family transcriptional regulator, cyclic AMP receptor protein